MKKTILRIISYLVVMAFGIFIGWWSNELDRFAKAMGDVRVPNIDTLNYQFRIDSLILNNK